MAVGRRDAHHMGLKNLMGTKKLSDEGNHYCKVNMEKN